MHDDADDLAGDDEDDRDDDAAVAGGAATPVWPPADATLAQLEDWLESLRRLPEEDAVLARQGALSRRTNELRTPLPAARASPLSPSSCMRAKRATDKRRKQLQRFLAMREGLLAEWRALQATIADARATIEATERLLTMAETEEYERFCDYASSQDAPGRAPSPEAAGSASAAAARRAGGDPDVADVAAGVSGIIKQLLMLPTAAEASNFGAAYAAVLEQARLVHKELTGDMGPTLELAPPPSRQVDAGGGGVAPRMAWVAGDADFGSTGMSVPPSDAAARALVALAAPPSAVGPPVSHGGYAGVVMGGPAPTLAEAAGHEARARAASRSLERARPPTVLPSSGSRGEDRERSPRGSALASALAAAAAAAEAEVRVSTDDYMPDVGPMPMPGPTLPRIRRASGTRIPLVSCGSRLPRQRPSCASPLTRVVLLLTWKPPGQMQTPLRPLLMPRLQPPSLPP